MSAKQELSAWIDDGQERDGFIAPVKGLHGGLRFKFRPALHRVRMDYLRKSAGFEDGNGEDEYVCGVIVKHVTSWEGRPTVDADGARRLHPDVRVKAMNQILGYNGAETDAGNSHGG